MAVGSDTIQDVANAFAGNAPGPNTPGSSNGYAPLIAGNNTNAQISSFDATTPPNGTTAAPGCIVTRLGGAQFDRPLRAA